MRTFGTIFSTVFYLVLTFIFVSSSLSVENVAKPPTVLIAVLIRNKEHILPYFLTYLQNLSYPKDRIALWFRSDHNIDNSTEIVEVWLEKFKDQYHHVDFTFEATPKGYKDESSPTDWHDARYNHLIALKEKALLHAKQIWADFLFMLDADVLLTHPETLSHLVSLHLPIVAPRLISRGFYSNFWCGMSPNFLYQRTDEYKDIIINAKIGHFKVPMVYSAVLINLNYLQTNLLTFDKTKLISLQSNNLLEKTCPPYTGPLDDIIIFAVSANCSGVPMFISNEKVFGYIIQPLDSTESIDRDKIELLNIKTTIIVDHPIGDVLGDDVFRKNLQFSEKHKLTLDHIYMIDFERRSERRLRMKNLFRELGLDVEYFPGIDGKKLSLDIIRKIGIEFFEGYEDPYHHRIITKDDIGVFLSHYLIWKSMIEKNQKEALILQHDFRFEADFTAKATNVLQQARNVGEFDLIFFGRSIGKGQVEPKVEKCDNLVHPGYSYWTLGYVLTLEGAKKLVASQPLKKLMPVDEFLSVMFNGHHNNNWNAKLSLRNFKAYSADPLLLVSTDFWEQDGSLNETENLEIVSENLLKDVTDVQYESKLSFAENPKSIKVELHQLKNEIS